MNSGKCFGSCPLFSFETNPATAQAIDEVTLLILPQEEYNHLVHGDAQFAAALLRIYSQRLAHLAHVSEGLGAWRAGDRINDCLLTYADRVTPQPIVHLSQEKLADLAGTAREVVTRHLSQLKAAGIIEVAPGRILIRDSDALKLPCVGHL